MPYKATTSFVGTDGNGKKWSVSAGQELPEVPPGTDWLTCGFLEEIKTTTIRKSTTRKRATRKAAKG